MKLLLYFFSESLAILKEKLEKFDRIKAKLLQEQNEKAALKQAEDTCKQKADV